MPADNTSTLDILRMSAQAAADNKGFYDRAFPGEVIVTSQWDAILRRLQDRIRTLLGPVWSFDLTTGSCTGGTQRSSSDVEVSGVWDQVTAEGLAALMCRTSKNEVAALIAQYPTLAHPEFPAPVVRAILAFAFVFTHVGTIDANEAHEQEVSAAKGIRIPSGALLPSLAIPVQSATPDANWFAIYSPQSDPSPVPPSAGRPTRYGYFEMALGLAGLAGLGYLVWTSFSHSSPSPRSNPRKR